MSSAKVSRKELCPCGSGKKFSKCCLNERRRQPVNLPPSRAAARALHPSADSPFGPVSVATVATIDDDGRTISPSDVVVLPIEIALAYSFPEPCGIAEVTHVLPAGRIYRLADGREIVNDDLEPGMQVVLRDGAIGTISSVERRYEPPDPPIQVKPGVFLARVVGTIRHRGQETIDVGWAGSTVTSSTDHRFYSVSRGDYVAASQLRVGEILEGDAGEHVPVTSIGERKLGLVELYNVEVEHFHNYHVGEGPSVLVHNGAAGGGGYINTPEDNGPARQRSGNRRKYMGQNPSHDSTTYEAVVVRMRNEGRLVGEGPDAKVLASTGEWIPIANADLSHVNDAVRWWNEVGRHTSPRSPEVRAFMRDPDNFVLDARGANRAAGAKLGLRYLPPASPSD